MQMFLFVLVFVTLGAGVAFGVDGYFNIRVPGMANAPEGYRYPQISDGWVTLVSGFIIWMSEHYFVHPVFKPIMT